MRPLVKVCGITNLIDAKNALNLGADYIGFINIHSSARFVTSQEIEDIVSQLSEDERAKVVLLTDISSVDALVNFANSIPAKIIQPYGSFAVADLSQLKDLGYRIFQPLHVSSEDDLTAIDNYQNLVDFIILDTKPTEQGQLGGTGEAFDWSLFNQAKERAKSKLALAGGLKAENIEAAIKTCGPEMIDLSSGLESRAGQKSLDKLKELFSKLNAILHA
ncbi:MAG: phosphoribosylanthranilate isomerase [Candidatus Melainabacteria bacterium]|nr:phosphoribosylanthranilate isomerase [Candidatus Melainabacteria bacterium]